MIRYQERSNFTQPLYVKTQNDGLVIAIIIDVWKGLLELLSQNIIQHCYNTLSSNAPNIGSQVRIKLYFTINLLFSPEERKALDLMSPW